MCCVLLQNNFLFNLYSGIRCAVHVEAATSALTAKPILQAMAALQPTVLDTVPWIAEECLLLLQKGDPSAAPLKSLAYLLAGGAALNEELLLPICAAHGVPLWPHYGQTELGGPALLGGLEGSLSAMRPPPGIGWDLRLEDGSLSTADGAKGELILYNMLCATPGYLELPGGTKAGRDLGEGKPTSERFCTGDVFRAERDPGTGSTRPGRSAEPWRPCPLLACHFSARAATFSR